MIENAYNTSGIAIARFGIPLKTIDINGNVMT